MRDKKIMSGASEGKKTSQDLSQLRQVRRTK
jgi:hypothetical protein